jgi:hypothetical protein
MNTERPKSEPETSAPLCPHCGKAMRFARSIPGIGALPELWTFECRECVEAVTQEKPRLLAIG